MRRDSEQATRSIQIYLTGGKPVMGAAWVAGGLVKVSLRGSDISARSKWREGTAVE